jgi:hypothetical protein
MLHQLLEHNYKTMIEGLVRNQLKLLTILKVGYSNPRIQTVCNVITRRIEVVDHEVKRFSLVKEPSFDAYR